MVKQEPINYLYLQIHLQKLIMQIIQFMHSTIQLWNGISKRRLKSYWKAFWFLMILVMAGQFASSQSVSRYNDNWYFTNNNALNFTSGIPVNVVGCALDSSLYGNGNGNLEANSAISDGTGNLLFYTDGISVYDASNTAMPNGNNSLNGNYSATSGAIITHVPGVCNKYYVFTLHNLINAAVHDVLYYTIVDMTDAGNGTLLNPLGDVDVGQTNVLVFDSDTLAEKMVAIQKGFSEDYWILVRSATKDKFYAFEVSSSGVNAVPVISTISGLVFSSPQMPSQGWLAVTPQNDAIVEANSTMHSYLYSFDNLTGNVNNQDTLMINNSFPVPPYDLVYGVDFSPDGQIIYMGNRPPTGTDLQILQFDRGAGIGNVMGTKKVNNITPANSSEIFGSMHLQNDGIIYCTSIGQTALTTITNPDNWSTPNINYASLPLTGTLSLCLSNDFHYFQKPIIPDSIAGVDQTICLGTQATIGCISCDSIGAEYQWEPSSKVINPNNAITETIALSSSDTFIVHVMRCGDTITSDTVTITIPSIITTNEQATLCQGDSIYLEGAWQTMGGTFSDTMVAASTGCDSLIVTTLTINSIAATTSSADICQGDSLFVGGEYQTVMGNYLDTLSGTLGCDSVVTTNLNVHNAPVIQLTSDTSIFLGNTIDLIASGGNAYFWNTGETTSSISVSPTQTTTYTVLATIGPNCADTAYVTIIVEEIIGLFTPNIFSPNGDGSNDVFYVRGAGFSEFLLIIYNRWGEKVFESTDNTIGWDGTFNEKPVNPGVFVYYVFAKYTQDDTEVTKKGNITLIR